MAVFYQPPGALQPALWMTAMAQYSTVLITGASSGIGAALALELAAPGVTLHLSGRDAGRLAAVAEACRARGAATRAAPCWTCATRRRWRPGWRRRGRLDLVVANAGISAGAGEKAPESAAQTRAIFATNLDGVLNTVLPAIEAMRRQPPGADGWRGRIAVVASIAAFVAGSAAPAYCASKAAADAWTVATALGLRRDGIALTSVCPGYIRTAMTARNRFPMPGLMDADRAARIILRAVAAGRIRVIFPWWMGAGRTDRRAGAAAPGRGGHGAAARQAACALIKPERAMPPVWSSAGLTAALGRVLARPGCRDLGRQCLEHALDDAPIALELPALDVEQVAEDHQQFIRRFETADQAGLAYQGLQVVRQAPPHRAVEPVADQRGVVDLQAPLGGGGGRAALRMKNEIRLTMYLTARDVRDRHSSPKSLQRGFNAGPLGRRKGGRC